MGLVQIYQSLLFMQKDLYLFFIFYFFAFSMVKEDSEC